MDNKKNNKNKMNKLEKKEVIDLTSYISPEIVDTDVLGSYTGVTEETFYDGDIEEPVQDADDL